MSLVNVADLVDDNGLTFRENNLAQTHKIPLGALVEYRSCTPDEPGRYHGLRLFVVEHGRDCDGSPLYSLSFDKEAQKNLEKIEQMIDVRNWENFPEDQRQLQYNLVMWKKHITSGSILSGICEDSLHVV